MTHHTSRFGARTFALALAAAALIPAALQLQPTRPAQVTARITPTTGHGGVPDLGLAGGGVTAAAWRAAWLRRRTTPRSGGYLSFGYPRPGHSVRQGQRMACKRRNQQRHRRAARG